MTALAEAPPQTEEVEEPGEASPEALAIAGYDGQTVDRIAIKFAGGVRLDRSDAADCQLIRDLKLGKEVTLKVVGLVKGKPFEIVHDEDGYPGEVTLVTKLAVTSVYRPVADGTLARTGTKQLDLEGVEEPEDTEDEPH